MTQGKINEYRMGLVDRMFADHPRALGMSWLDHGVGAVGIGARLIGAGTACLVHAVVPGLFTQTAGRTVDHLYDHMQKRRSGAPDPENFPEYEI